MIHSGIGSRKGKDRKRREVCLSYIVNYKGCEKLFFSMINYRFKNHSKALLIMSKRYIMIGTSGEERSEGVGSKPKGCV